MKCCRDEYKIRGKVAKNIIIRTASFSTDNFKLSTTIAIMSTETVWLGMSFDV
jgi:hypothetical protein